MNHGAQLSSGLWSLMTDLAESRLLMQLTWTHVPAPSHCEIPPLWHFYCFTLNYLLFIETACVDPLLATYLKPVCDKWGLIPTYMSSSLVLANTALTKGYSLMANLFKECTAGTSGSGPQQVQSLCSRENPTMTKRLFTPTNIERCS